MEGDSDGTGLAERQKLHEDIELMKNVLQDDIDSEYCEEEEEEGDASDADKDPEWRPPPGDALDGDPAGDAGGSTQPELQPNVERPSVFQPVVADETDEDDDSESVDKEAGELLIHLEGEDLPTNPETCLALNRAYQEVIGQNLDRLELALVHNREQQQLLREEFEEDRKARKRGPAPGRKRHETHFAMPYFKDSDSMCPPPNEDTIIKKRNERDPLLKPPRIWTDGDAKVLQQAVKEDCLQRLLRPFMNRKELEHEKLEKASSDKEKQPIKDRIKKLNKEIEKARWTKESELYGAPDIDAKIDWMKISVVNFDGQFSASFLNHIWCSQEHPGFSRSSWTQEEDHHLVELAEANGNKRWDVIAAQLGTSRSAFQCLSRFQTKLNPCLETGKWSEAEDNLLKEAVTGLAVNNYIPWHLVGEFMEGRTQEKCKERWAVMKSNFRKGRWTTEEDKNLLAAVHCYGQNWMKVQEFVPTRNLSQCRERWQNSLCQEIKYGQWTYEEDRKLVLLYRKYGSHWARISKEMTGRTDNMVLQRHRRMMKWKQQNDVLASYPQESVQALHRIKDEEEKSNDKNSQKTTEKIERLLEQQIAEREWRKMPQNGGLMIWDSENNRKDDREGSGQQSASCPDQSPRQGPSEVQSDVTETGPGDKEGSEKMSMLDMVAKRVFRERQVAWEHERKLIEEDLKKGIYVPRPPYTVSTRNSFFVQERCSLSNIIRKHVRETLESTAKSTPENVFRLMEESLKSQVVLTEDKLPKHIKDILSAATASFKRNTGLGRPVTQDGALDIDDELAMLVRGRVTRKARKGRPRRFFVNEESPESSATDELMADKVTKIMMLALNLQREGTIAMAKAIESNEQQSSGEGKVLLLDRKKTIETKPAVTDSVVGDVALLTRLVGPADNMGPHPLPKVQRKAHKGSAAKAYGVPPLPPNCLTLNAYRLLLTYKQELVAQARRHRPVESDAGEAESDETLYLRTKNAHLRSSDIDNAMVKRLGNKFPRWQILQARRALSKIEKHKKKQQHRKKTEEAKKGMPRKVHRKVMVGVKQSHDYHMLKARFLSLFLWPALLSTVDVQQLNSGTDGHEGNVSCVSGNETNQPGKALEANGDVPQPSTSTEGNKPGKVKKSKGKNRFALSGTSRARQMSAMSREAKETFRKKCEESYRKRTLERGPGADSDGQDGASPSQSKRKRTSSENESRRVSSRALVLQEKKKQKKEEGKVKEEEIRKKREEMAVENKMKRLQRAAARGSNPSIDKRLLAAGRERRMKIQERKTAEDGCDPAAADQ